MNLIDKTAVISGASQGIGAAISRALAMKGVKVILLARSEDLLKSLSEEISKQKGESHYYTVDLTDHEETMKVLKSLKSVHGVPDIIVNNAGVGRFIPIEETDYDEARKMITLPYLAAFDITRFFSEGMLERNSGNITFINSPASIQPWASAVGYSSARWALRGLAEALSADLYGTNITVSHIIAGKTTSNYWKNNPSSEEILPAIEKILPVLSPESVAKVVVKAIESDRKRVTYPLMLGITKWLHNLFPRLVRWSVLATGVKRKMPL